LLHRPKSPRRGLFGRTKGAAAVAAACHFLPFTSFLISFLSPELLKEFEIVEIKNGLNCKMFSVSK